MIPYRYRNDTLEAIARKVISQYDPSLLMNPVPVPVETIIEKVYGLTLEFQYIRNNGRVLGETVFENAVVPIYSREGERGYKLVPVNAGTVIIDASLLSCRGDGRFRYTCAHELAHWVLHKEFYTSLGETAALSKAVRSSEIGTMIERQADRLSSYLLMPKGAVKTAFFLNKQTTGDVIRTLAEIFQVSRQAMEIRLKEMQLLS